VAALALAGCGGGGGGSSSTSTTSGPTHAQYVRAANAICATAQRQAAPLIARVKSSAGSLLTGGAGATKLAAVVTALHDAAAADLAKLRALAQPAGGGAAIERFLRPLSTVIADIGQAAKALGAGQAISAVALISQAQPLAASVTRAARAYGATQCGSVLAALG